MRALLVAAALVATTLAGPGAVADVNGGGLPVEDYATYDPQTTCTRHPRVGTVALGEWLVATYGGAGGAVNRPCSDPGTSEHKDGRAVDWVLDASSPADRKLAKTFLEAAFATDAEGNPAALARRMGVMYIIWDDHFYPAYHEFRRETYLSSSCRSRRTCSKTLRHRDHMHISLSKAGAKALTSFYVDLVPGAGVSSPTEDHSSRVSS
jgi:hypothetical protein